MLALSRSRNNVTRERRLVPLNRDDLSRAPPYDMIASTLWRTSEMPVGRIVLCWLRVPWFRGYYGCLPPRACRGRREKSKRH